MNDYDVLPSLNPWRNVVFEVQYVRSVTQLRYLLDP